MDGFRTEPTGPYGSGKRVHRLDENGTGRSKGTGDKVYVDASNISTTRLSCKLSHRQLGPYQIERQVSKNAYRLKLLNPMRRLHPVFNVVKLIPAPSDPIVGCRSKLPPPPELIEEENEYLVEEILDSKMFHG
jgi:hypothetical protein